MARSYAMARYPRLKGRRESVKEKGDRLLVERRLRIHEVREGFISAECKGDSGKVYVLGWDGTHWTCSCPARIACSHLHALWAVTGVKESRVVA